MMEAARTLHLVDTSTGEATEFCEGCATRDQTIERLTRSYEGTIRNLRDQLEKQEAKVASPEIERVFACWAEMVVQAGLWTVKPKLTEVRQAMIAKRLGQGYSVRYLETVMESVLFSRGGVKQAWVDIPALLAEPSQDGKRWHMEARYEDVVARLRAPGCRPEFEPLVKCDGCLHIFAEHAEAGCLVHGCDCTEFQDVEWRAERWKREHA